MSLPSADPDLPKVTDLARQRDQAKYDAEGFITSYQPHLTEQQTEWLSWRMGLATDLDACEATQIDPSIIEGWRADPEFADIYTQCLTNKREAFRYLATQLLPKTLRTINTLLDSPSVSAQTRGVQLLLRTQGLLIDKKILADRDSIQKLVDALRAPQPIILEGQAQELD